MKLNKKDNRLRRARRTRAKIRELRVLRLSVHRTPRHIYAQIIDADGGSVLVSASTVQKTVGEGLKGTGNIDAAKKVGQVLADLLRRVDVARERGFRSLGLPIPRSRESAGRRRSRSGSQLLIKHPRG